MKQQYLLHTNWYVILCEWLTTLNPFNVIFTPISFLINLISPLVILSNYIYSFVFVYRLNTLTNVGIPLPFLKANQGIFTVQCIGLEKKYNFTQTIC